MLTEAQLSSPAEELGVWHMPALRVPALPAGGVRHIHHIMGGGGGSSKPGRRECVQAALFSS